jgi:hypothetical protein
LTGKHWGVRPTLSEGQVTKSQAAVAVLLIMDVFLLLPPATQQHLLDEATLLVAIGAVVILLSKPKS